MNDNEKINQIINSLEHIDWPEPNPFLLTRIHQRIENDEILLSPLSPGSFRLSMAGLLLVVFVNIGSMGYLLKTGFNQGRVSGSESGFFESKALYE